MLFQLFQWFHTCKQVVQMTFLLRWLLVQMVVFCFTYSFENWCCLSVHCMFYTFQFLHFNSVHLYCNISIKQPNIINEYQILAIIHFAIWNINIKRCIIIHMKMVRFCFFCITLVVNIVWNSGNTIGREHDFLEIVNDTWYVASSFQSIRLLNHTKFHELQSVVIGGQNNINISWSCCISIWSIGPIIQTSSESDTSNVGNFCEC